MTSVKKTRQLILRFEGTFDYDGLHNAIQHFFAQRKYSMIEKNWKEKNSALGRKIKVKLVPFRRDTEYIKFDWDITWETIDLRTIEVIRDGKTVKLDAGSMHIVVSAKVTVDYQNYKKTHKSLGTFFDKNVFDMEIKKNYKGPLEKDVQKFMDMLKKELGMSTTPRRKQVVQTHG